MTTKGNAAQSKATEDRPERDDGRLDEALVARYLAENGLPADGTLPERAARLEAHYEKVTPKKKLLDCGTCGYASSKDVDACPFCGETGVEEQAPKPAQAAPAAAPPKPGKAPKGAPLAAPEPPASGPATSGGDEVPPDVAAAAANVAEGGTVEELDAGIRRVADAQAKGVESYWEIGRELFEIFSRKLFLQRRDPESKAPRYKAWSQFCAHELDVSSTHSYRMMDVAVKFSREDAVLIGVKKAMLLLRVPDGSEAADIEKVAKQKAAFDDVLKKALGGMAYSELEKAVEPLIPKGQRRNTGRKPMPAGPGNKGKGPKAQAAPEGSVTVALSLQRVVIPLFAKGEKPGKDGAKRAKKLADGPIGEEILMNGVVRRYTASINSAGFLELVVTTKRRDA